MQGVAADAIQAGLPFFVDALHNGLLKLPQDAGDAVRTTITSIIKSFDAFWAALLGCYTQDRSEQVQLAACHAVMDIVRAGVVFRRPLQRKVD
jgi:hypothetical protein